jgi:hypothetical protein
VHYFDNRGMSWEKTATVGCANCTNAPNAGCTCNPGALAYELAGPAGEKWTARFPDIVATLSDPNCVQGAPCYNDFSNNTYCRASKVFSPASAADIAKWHSTATGNVEHCN